MKCARCHRTLKNPGRGGLGPVCAASLLGPLPKVRKGSRSRAKVQAVDEQQVELFAEVAA